MKFTEGSFKDWGYQFAAKKYKAIELMVVLGILLQTQSREEKL